MYEECEVGKLVHVMNNAKNKCVFVVHVVGEDVILFASEYASGLTVPPGCQA